MHLSTAEATNLFHAWSTGKTCGCGECPCCETYRTMAQPVSPYEKERLSRMEQAHRSATGWNQYMRARQANG